MKKTIWLFLACIIALADLCGCSRHPASKYTLDLLSPSELVFNSNYSDNTGEVRVYVTGPQGDLDSRTRVDALLRLQPNWATKDPATIKELVNELSDHKQGSSISSATSGVTYHVLLIDKSDSKIMHFRIFVPQSRTTEGVVVYPRSETGFGYDNFKIFAFLGKVVPK